MKRFTMFYDFLLPLPPELRKLGVPCTIPLHDVRASLMRELNIQILVQHAYGR